MSSPLDAITYNQEAGYLPVNLVVGDDLPISIALPFDITSYTFSGSVLDSLDNLIVNFTVTPGQLTPTGVVVISLTGLQTATIPSGSKYFVQWVTGGKTRTFLAGPISAVDK